METAEISIIVPTLNEAENIPQLLSRVAAAMGDRSYEIILVDDNSRDNTRAVCAELSARYPLHLIIRNPPKNGLSGAVLAGMKQARGQTFLVMDADLQHPPERIPELLAALDHPGTDFVIGSRYMPGGSTEMEWGIFRKLNSWAATLLARPFAGKTTDPMSGFFALRRSTYEGAERLTPLGYKIALELMCKSRVKRVAEVPIDFKLREKGESKLTIKQQFKYLEHLSRLYDYTFPRASPFMKFWITLICSWGVAIGVFGFMLEAFRERLHPVLSPVFAYPAAILITAIFHLRYVRTQREFLVAPPWRDFAIISLAEWATCAIVATWMMGRFAHPIQAIEMFVYPFAAAAIARYALRKELLRDIRGLRQDKDVDDSAIKPATTPADFRIAA